MLVYGEYSSKWSCNHFKLPVKFILHELKHTFFCFIQFEWAYISYTDDKNEHLWHTGPLTLFYTLEDYGVPLCHFHLMIRNGIWENILTMGVKNE